MYNTDLPLLFICKNEVFNNQGRLIWQKKRTVGCPLLKCNKTFLAKYDSSSDFFLRDHTDGSLVSTTSVKTFLYNHFKLLRKLSGYKKSEFSEEKTGINWCK